MWIGPPEDESDVLFIWDLLIDQKERGRGHGTQALDLVVHEACRRGLSAVCLNVFDANDGARRLYERNGFHVRHADGVHVTMIRPVGDIET